MKKLIYLLAFVFLISLLVGNVRADYNVFDSDDNINVFNYCTYINNSACGDDVSCTITAIYPNSSFVDQNKPMTNNWNDSFLGFYNYSFGVLDVEGTYSALVHCNNTDEGVTSFDFSVGDPDTTEENTKWLYIFLLVIPAFLIIFSYQMDDPWFMLMGGFLILVFGVYINLNGLIDLSGSYMEDVIFVIIMGIGFWFIVKPVIYMIKEGYR